MKFIPLLFGLLLTSSACASATLTFCLPDGVTMKTASGAKFPTKKCPPASEATPNGGNYFMAVIEDALKANTSEF